MHRGIEADVDRGRVATDEDIHVDRDGFYGLSEVLEGSCDGLDGVVERGVRAWREMLQSKAGCMSR